MNANKLSPMALGLALGVLWGVLILSAGLLAHYFTYGISFVASMQTIYIGYAPTLGGSIIGGLFGFIDGLIGGVIIAWLYNCFLKCCQCCSKSSKCQ